MENEAYSYPGIELWDRATWQDRYSGITPLASWIEEENYGVLRAAARTGHYDGRTDGVWTAKTRSVTYPDVVEAWRERGMEYVTDEMGQVTWIAMIPRAARTEGPEGHPLLLVLHDGDYTNPNWAMEALDHYEPLLAEAAASGTVVLVVAPDGPDASHIYVNMVQELSVRQHLPLRSVHLDVSTVFSAGLRLADVPGLVYRTLDGVPAGRPDDHVRAVAGVPALDITGRWQNQVSHLFENATASRYAHPDVHLEHIVHSEAGKRMAEGMALERDFTDATDPGLTAFWEARGVRYACHDTDGQRWVALAPAASRDPQAEPLPVMLVFQEVTYLDPFQPVSALSSYVQYGELVAQGQLVVVFFALETPDDNDLGMEIVRQAAEHYPVDLTRLYVTGHSHNGHFCMEFARRHHREVAAAAALGNAYGLPAPEYSHEAVTVTDEKVALMETFDLPVIDIAGYSESDFVGSEVGTQAFDDAVDSWSRRARASRLPPLRAEAIAAAKSSDDLVARRLGVPPDRSSVEYRMGGECYIGDFFTTGGAHRLRLVALEHFPHMVAPQMPSLTWDFVRRFARDPQTGAVVELY
ncbi:hypothetical protein [Isoptericola aurantiacus]|uniref:hypothetical protein n=1 Tax=Isoptericola aurantiacus TaxID=3377839 RepID=UPI003839EDB1